MGNAVSPCLGIGKRDSTSSSVIKLVFWGGGTRTLPSAAGKRVAGEVMFEFPDRLLCAADAFILGRRIPSLSISDELHPGNTYFVLPIDLFPGETLTAASLAALSPGQTKSSPINFGDSSAALEYVKGADGRLLIKVSPDFITNAIVDRGGCVGGIGGSSLCSTPELKKHYEQLVGSARDRPWSPTLETISEKNGRRRTPSPARLLGLEWIR